MKLSTDYIGYKNSKKVDLTNNTGKLIKELRKSIECNGYIFKDNYYYRKVDGSKVYLSKMDRQYRINALNYFKDMEGYTKEEWDFIYDFDIY